MDIKSLEKLNNIDPRLKLLCEEVFKISKVKFIITEGLRTKERQEQLFQLKKTMTMNSKHLTGKACDFCPIVNSKIDFNARDDIMFLCGIFYTKAKELNISIRIGCIWDNQSIKENKFIDAYHLELQN